MDFADIIKALAQELNAEVEASSTAAPTVGSAPIARVSPAAVSCPLRTRSDGEPQDRDAVLRRPCAAAIVESTASAVAEVAAFLVRAAV